MPGQFMGQLEGVLRRLARRGSWERTPDDERVRLVRVALRQLQHIDMGDEALDGWLRNNVPRNFPNVNFVPHPDPIATQPVQAAAPPQPTAGRGARATAQARRRSSAKRKRVIYGNGARKQDGTRRYTKKARANEPLAEMQR